MLTDAKMTTKQPREPIAIVGSACRFPGGANSPSSLWSLLQSPRDVCTTIPAERFDTAGFYHPDGSHHGTTNVQTSYLMQEDVRTFDAAFFNISANEADSIDPQQRLLLEVVYEALEAGGHTLDALRGSDTAVFTGTMTADYNETLTRDHNTMPTYFATGTNRAIISNRVSYFFDWHGPSMTIDTACSSSLIAVHQGVQALRTGESRVAVAAGTQVILNPEMYINESKLKMLSPTGRSRMWDESADGYARGEGVAVVVLKLLSDAIADGDNIECVIRETGVNQDGFSNGLTVPNTDAQAALIRQTYARAGLDPATRPDDRPQFFEAHGTGTQAGDPKEAAAIHQTFGAHVAEGEAPLYVGSVKTVIGHLEGAAGLAGVLKASAMLREGYMTPNLLFNKLNPRVEPFYQGLRVSTELRPWPTLPEGVPRRASVNSFGFGGTNAHAILEHYQDSSAAPGPDSRPSFLPFVFSAMTEASLVAQLQAYQAYLAANQERIDADDLAWTLQSRRSQLPYKAAFSAVTMDQLASKIDAKLLEATQNTGTAVGTRSSAKTAPRLLGVFTGQGAQWPAMGAHLIRSSPFVRKRVADLEQSLAGLPQHHRPAWSLMEEMLAGDDTSRMGEAALSQPLCTVVQIVLVDLLRAAGVTFAAVVGHSSGEIGAAYAAGFLSDTDALRVAYYRGLFARAAGNEETNQKGAMLAVGTSWDDAEDLVKLRVFKGRLALAAHNSPASVTLSGDADAVIHAKKVFDEEKKFARPLKVDTAYHSHHMLPCGGPYVQALRDCGVRVIRDRPADAPAWFSSVFPSAQPMEASEDLEGAYWRDNMCNAVLFAEAVTNAVVQDAGLNLVVEVGPHPALKGPAVQTMAEVRTSPLPYTGLLSRGKNDLEAFSEAVGFLWTNAPKLVDFTLLRNTLVGDEPRRPRLVTGLPKYCWNHARRHWTESRISRRMRQRKTGPHEILGFESPDSNAHDMRWSNVLKPSEVGWLEGHQLQGQTVFPAAGYVAMALEASRSLAGQKSVRLFELHDLVIPRAITFEEGDNNGVETLVALTSARHSRDSATAEFACYSSPVLTTGSEQEMELMARGNVKILFGSPDVAALSSTPAADYNMTTFDSKRFYESLAELGYGYHGPFQTMSSMKRRLNQSAVLVASYPYTEADQSHYMVHPSTLDVAFQSSILAYSAPGDGRLWSLSVPTSIGVIRVNPHLCASQPLSGADLPVHATLDASSQAFSGNIDVFDADARHGMIQVEDLAIKSFAPATKADDRVMYTETQLGPYVPVGEAAMDGMRPSALETELATICERISYYYIRKWKLELSDAEWMANEQQPHWAHLLNWVNEQLSQASRGQHPTIAKEWAQDTSEAIAAMVSRYADRSIDVKLLHAVGENLPAAVRGETTILEHMLPNNMLDDWYKRGLGFERYNTFLARTMGQITHRYPHARILEIGAGTGGATKAVLDTIGDRFSSYTYTDVSVGFFPKAEELFAAHAGKMTFKLFDAEKTPASQGYKDHAYDIIVASNVLHATESMQRTLENTRRLLRPGGYLVLLEITGQAPVRYHSIVGSVPGWWLGVNDGRRFSPLMTPVAWNAALRKAGFSGVDAVTPEVDGVAWPLSIITSQAVDDRVGFLRRPLAAPASAVRPRIESLVVLGNGALETSRLAEDLVEDLGRFCGEVTVLEGLPTEAEAAGLNPASTFVNLVDLEAPLFRNVTEAGVEGLQRMVERAKSVTWVTRGAELAEPYHMASIAFLRALRLEQTHITFNHIDVPDLEPGGVARKAVAEYVLRQSALDDWGAPPSVLATPVHRQAEFLWSKEYEVFADRGGGLRIPRLVKNGDRNARLNASQRVITKTVSAAQANLSIVAEAADTPLKIVEQFAHRQEQDAASSSSGARVRYSTMLALHVAADTYLFPSIGVDQNNGQLRACLSSANASEVQPVASVSVPPSMASGADDGELLVAIASELLVEALLDQVSSGSHILLHASGRDAPLASAFCRAAGAGGTRVSFSCDMQDTDVTDAGWTRVDARASNDFLRKRLRLVRPTHFVDLTLGADELGLRVAQNLPPNCTQIRWETLLRHHSSFPSGANDSQALEQRLYNAVLRARPMENSGLIVPLAGLGNVAHKHATSGVHWPSEGSLEVEVRPLDAPSLFSKDKSYLLVGLTGQLGQSLAEWMASNGAGCIVLTSRRPNVDQRWLASFQGSGTTVKVMSMDVLDKSKLGAAVEEIRATCPPIGGVANGAMVLEDSLFTNMSAETMNKVLGPKIDGSRHLDEVFGDKLDFFVLLSSVAYVVGNTGQSNYAAANGYLQGLARQRRRRGLAASVIDIGRVTGIGYIEAASDIVREQLKKFRLAPVSEIDLRQAFAETIQAGYPVPHKDDKSIPNVTVTTGIRTICDDEDIRGPWFVNSVFSHIITESRAADASVGDKDAKAVLPVAQQLLLAESPEAGLGILQDAFSAKLRVMLQLGDQEIDSDTPLVELGIDSLVAVEVRSWFLKELKVDIPVLKIVGGATVVELCERAFEKLAPEMQPGPIGTPVKPKPTATPSPAQLPTTPSKEDEVTESDSVYTPASVTSDRSDFPLETPGTATTYSGPATPNPKSSSLASGNDGPAAGGLFSPAPKQQPETKVAAAPRRFLKSERISLSQSRFWYLQHMLDDQTAPNVTFSYCVTGDLRIGDLEKAIRVVTTRHEALRTCFVGDEADPGEAYQKVMPSSPVRLERKNVASVEAVDAEFKALQKHVFDLGSGDVMRLVLLKLTPSEHYLLVNYHHIVMDGASFQVFLADLEKAYNGSSLGAPPRQYPDISAAQRRALDNNEMDADLGYWRNMFPAGEQPPVLPLLPMARTSARVAMKDFNSHQVGRWLDPAVLERVKALARAQRSTPFHLHLAAFKAILFCFAGPETQDVTIGIADAARGDSDVANSIGFFLNLLPLRFRRRPEQTFAEAVSEARDATHAALGSSRLPFDVLLSKLNVARSSLHSPFFQAFLDYRQGTQEKQAWGNVHMAYHDIHPGRTAYDVTLDVLDNPGDVYLMVRVQKSLYDVTAANLLLEMYVHFLDVATRDASLMLQDTPFYGEAQRDDAVRIGRDLVSDWPETLPHRIDQVAEQNSDKTALVDGAQGALTYGAMRDRIQVMAQALREAGVGAGSRVLVFQQPTVNWACSMLAIMHLGAVYVPLDLRNPLERLATIAKDCEAGAVLADASTLADAPQLRAGAIIVNVSSLSPSPSSRIAIRTQSDAPAAILYTSGSTGTPKGIVVTHAGLRNEIEGYTKTWGLGAERVLQQSAMTFNHSSDQMYTGLVNGGTVYVVPAEKRGDPLSIARIIQEQDITYTKATPSEYLLWLRYGRDSLTQAAAWRFAFGGGEQLTTTVTDEFASLQLPGLGVYNSYGPTEVSISSHKMALPYQDGQSMGDLGRIPCGYSLPNYHTYIVDENLQALPVGLPGEICIGGAGVSLGYLNNPELTDRHFVANPFATPEDRARGWDRLYRTGDLGYLRNDGALIFQSRIAGDTQVKIRGIRIELQDIESAIVSAADGALSEAVVTLRDNDLLVAHVVFAPQHDAPEDRDLFLDRLLSRLPLPQYMVPAVAIPLAAFPVSNHAKVDRRAVRAMVLPARTRRDETPLEMTDTMLQLRLVWQQVLGPEWEALGLAVGPASDFFLVGGNSLLAIRLQAHIRTVFATTVPLVQLLESSTLAHMARTIEACVGAQGSAGIDWERETRPPTLPAFLAGVPPGAAPGRRGPKTFLVTGGTSFTARYLLPKLAASDAVAAIHCVAVRDRQRDRAAFAAPKVVYHGGDLAAPRLGLSEAMFGHLAGRVDVIVHMGAVRGFFDGYAALRPSNVNPTRELVRLAAPRRVPIHYLSSAGVLPRAALAAAAPPGSAALHVPAADGRDGYVASKWVSEQVLERSAAALGVPSSTYRFVPASSSSSPAAPAPPGDSGAKRALLAELGRLVHASGRRPDMRGWAGRVDFIPAEQAAQFLADALVATGPGAPATAAAAAAPTDHATHVVHCDSPIALDAAELRAVLDDQGAEGLASMPLLKWFGHIKTCGFSYLLTSQDVTVDASGNGEAVIESRR